MLMTWRLALRSLPWHNHENKIFRCARWQGNHTFQQQETSSLHYKRALNIWTQSSGKPRNKICGTYKSSQQCINPSTTHHSNLSAQTEEAVKSNNLCCNRILCQVSRDKSKKDWTKKIHPSIIQMVCQAAATNLNNDNRDALPMHQPRKCWHGPIWPSTSN